MPIDKRMVPFVCVENTFRSILNRKKPRVVSSELVARAFQVVTFGCVCTAAR
jgi:hypothetical protein